MLAAFCFDNLAICSLRLNPKTVLRPFEIQYFENYGTLQMSKWSAGQPKRGQILADSLWSNIFERGTTRVEDAQGTPTQSHISLNILVNEDSPTFRPDFGRNFLAIPVCGGSFLRLIDSCIAQLKAQGPSRTCHVS